MIWYMNKLLKFLICGTCFLVPLSLQCMKKGKVKCIKKVEIPDRYFWKKNFTSYTSSKIEYDGRIFNINQTNPSSFLFLYYGKRSNGLPEEKNIYLFDTEKDKIIKTFKNDTISIRSLYQITCNYFYSLHKKSKIKLWNTKRAEPLNSFYVSPKLEDPVIARTPKSLLVGNRCEKKLYVYDLSKKSSNGIIENKLNSFQKLHPFNKEQVVSLSGCDSQVVKIWDTNKKKSTITL